MNEIGWSTPEPVTLEHRCARLEPLSVGHADDLFAVGRDAAIWRYMPVSPPGDVAAMAAWIEQALEELAAGRQIPFAIVDCESGRAVGSTRYLDIQPVNRALEVGWTWIGEAFQRTAINTECKLLLLRYAFETLGAFRVQLKTDLRNERSQRAIERIGATREGVLRQNMLLWDGHRRDSVYYSVLVEEWPRVRGRLVALIERR